MLHAAINALAIIGGTYIFLVIWGEVWEWLQPEDSTQSGKRRMCLWNKRFVKQLGS